MSNPEELNGQIWQHLRRGQAKEAAQLCERLTREHPDYAGGWYAGSHLALVFGQPQAALQNIDRALLSEPQKFDWLLQKLECLGVLGDVPQALALAEKLRQSTAVSSAQAAALGKSFERLGQPAAARDQFKRSIELDPTAAVLHLDLARSELALGNKVAVEAAIDACLALDKDNADAHYLRSSLGQQTAAQNNVEALRAAVDRAAQRPRDQVRLQYALAKEYDDLAEFDRAFQTVASASGLRRTRMQYKPDNELAAMRSVRTLFDADRLAKHFAGYSSSEPIFVVGMPRSGNSLVEGILASHSTVVSAGDSRAFANALLQQCQAAAGDQAVTAENALTLATEVDFTALGEGYLSTARPSSGAAHFVDRLAMNFLYLGPIHMALPQAKIIVLQRDPMDNCLTLFKTLFDGLYPFTYDQQELARYFVEYQSTVTHWLSVMGDAIHVVRYEEMVASPESTARAVLNFCGLTVEEACVDVFGNSAVADGEDEVALRRGYFEASVGHWRSYEKHLQPMIAILDDAGLLV